MPLTVAGFLNEFVSATVLPLDEVLMPLFSPGESSCGVLYPALVSVQEGHGSPGVSLGGSEGL